MQASDFTEKSAGQLVKGLSGAWAFRPEPLPPTLGWSDSLVTKLEDASRRLGELRGIAHRLLNPALLIRPFVNREAVLSSRIEGTQSGLAQLAFFQLDQAKTDADAREVDNYRVALDHGLRSKLPVSLRLMREMHEILMRDGRREINVKPGELRTSQNWIGPPGCRIEDATYVPPPPELVVPALSVLEKYIHASSRPPGDLPALVRIALVHYQFEAIHPFDDGNGRIGRLLIVLLLCRWDLLPQPLLYLSAFFERRREEYYRRLREVSQAGRWREWLLFFLEGVATEARDAARRSGNLLELRDHLRGLFPKGSVRVHRLIDKLLLIPVTTIPRAAEDLDVTFRAASLIVAKLVKAGVLVEAGRGPGQARLFVARSILDATEQPLPAEPGTSR
jgi:Fic family protein